MFSAPTMNLYLIPNGPFSHSGSHIIGPFSHILSQLFGIEHSIYAKKHFLRPNVVSDPLRTTHATTLKSSTLLQGWWSTGMFSLM